MFETASFIKPNVTFDPAYKEENLAPMFRKTFLLQDVQTATLSLCALGFGYCWLNGRRVTEDVLTSAISDYRKTLWVHTYDVTSLLQPGENVLALWCGNGWYNETLQTPWGLNKAVWRDHPKFILELVVDGKPTVVSDSTWKCCEKTAVTFNQLRSGEYFDARLFDPAWNTLGFQDSAWRTAAVDHTPPSGVFRLYPCQGVRECESFPTVRLLQTGETRYVFDIGQNISGYVRLKIRQALGDVITIRYGEQIDENGVLQFGDRMEHFYPESPFQTDRFICNGEEAVWSPLFTYHGFRFVELTGVTTPSLDTITGIFVHLDVAIQSGFSCSDPLLNKLFRMGQMATLSNLQSIPTDCPTREKMGWANDMQSSAEQMLMNFDVSIFFRKWMADIRDSMREDGAIPGIIPTWGWGYNWGTGPASSGVLFELPFQVYLYTGDAVLLKEYYPEFKKHLQYIASRAEPSGLIGYGLCDWAGPFEKLGEAPTPVTLTDTVLYFKFLRIAVLAAEELGMEQDASQWKREGERISTLLKQEFLLADGTCSIPEQTAVSMLLVHGIYDSLPPLQQQLKQLVEERQFHHHCGMVGLRYLYDALDICGLQEYVFRIITATGFPSYSQWVEGGATTLWELWDCTGSKNHHMYSDFMRWLLASLAGIRPVLNAPGFREVLIEPMFVNGLDHCHGFHDSPYGRIEVIWKKENGGIRLQIHIPASVTGNWKGRKLTKGQYCFRGILQQNGEYLWVEEAEKID